MKIKGMRQQFADTMLDVGKTEIKLTVMVGDISHGILQPFAKEFPDRYFNIGILEPTMISLGAGMSRAGLYPVIHTIAPFIIERSFEQLKLDFCYHNLPGNIITVGSAFDYGYLGCTHHCYGDFALLKTLEGSQIIYPSSPIEFEVLFEQTYSNDALTFFRLPGATHNVSFKREDLEFGKGIKICDGDDLTIIAAGPQLNTAIGAREILLNIGVETEVIYIHSIKPLDDELIRDSVKKTRKVIVIEEHMRTGGLGDDVMRLVFELDGVEFSSASIPDTFVRNYGSYEDHCEDCGLTPKNVAEMYKTNFTS